MSQRALVFAIPGNLDSPTGGYGYDRRIISGLRAHGWQVQVLGLPDGFPHPTAADQTATLQALAGLPDGTLVMIDGLALGAMETDAVAEAAARLDVVALVHHPLGLEDGLEPARAQALLDAERAALAQVRRVVTTSDTTARTLQADFDIPCERLRVVPPGLDKPDLPPHDPVTDELETPATPLRLLSVGSLIPRKGHARLIEALAPLRDLDWTLRIVGGGREGDTGRDLQARIARHGLQARITLVGPVPDTAPELAQADVFVLPSRYEGYGMAFAEAMAYGLPVIGCGAGAVPEVVPPSAGILVPVDDVEALTDALRSLLTDAPRRQLLAAGARQAAAMLPDWSARAAQMAQVLEA
ncbi:glycosyltransferase family 4 protein [Pseudoxanthomonas sp. JBR18]|uniref:glycosyltransferase family 4 protein n=1 Tax=Pseudoxanthomonas sp. JBR18 TaxID=2969308 RepID=UPI002305E0E2|nr:glycosyltransferase family 4 protein [Pseudoxanthomonas sp. JBR18]WCE04806.1 glycosyltransferase family 4 protein [Pseudoxanthomonas sp. JBR18]